VKTRVVLDNPVWHALTGPHSELALGRGMARHYPRDKAPFSAIAQATRAAYTDLMVDLPPHAEARLFRPANEPAPTGWETLSARPILQMVYDGNHLPAASEVETRFSRLGQEDVADMLTLVDIAKPGPFAARTVELEVYVGVRQDENGELVATSGRCGSL
jgi:hypothetical protein